MKLHLLRHAKTDPNSKTGKDFDRCILPKGIAQSQKLAEHFQENVPDIDVWCSEATRTRETLNIIQEKRSFTHVKYSRDYYLASREKLLNSLWLRPGNDDLLIVGHNYGISDLATYLADEYIELRTGGYICIEFDGFSWQEISKGLGIITEQYRPKVRLS